jgi:beta-glucosidase-like glycosyl hydrolase
LILNGTIFNSPIGMGCSFNPELIEKMADVIAVESRAIGINQLFSPQVDLARELRFGRVEECFSEDPYLYVLTARPAARYTDSYSVPERWVTDTSRAFRLEASQLWSSIM